VQTSWKSILAALKELQISFAGNMGGKVVSERQTGRRAAFISIENFVAEASTNGNSIQNLVNPCFLLCSVDCSTVEGEVSLRNEVVAMSEYEKLPAATTSKAGEETIMSPCCSWFHPLI